MRCGCSSAVSTTNPSLACPADGPDVHAQRTGDAHPDIPLQRERGSDYESDDLSQVLASLNGALKGCSPSDYVVQLGGTETVARKSRQAGNS